MTNVRQWLGRARGIDREIEALLRDIQETRDRLMKITQSYTSDGAQNTKDPHKYDKLVELEDQTNQRIDELLEAKKEIASTIGKLEDHRQRTVLYSYYVRCKTLEQIAVEMHYSYRQTKRFHRQGVAGIQGMLQEEESNGGTLERLAGKP